MVTPEHPGYAEQCEQQRKLAEIREQLHQSQLQRINQHNTNKRSNKQ